MKPSKKKIKRPKIRRTWEMSPVERIHNRLGKKYTRKGRKTNEENLE